ncbi:MAG: hypothetical protein R3C20_25280 [Planctomycetaceae bacterium]
MTMSPSRLCLTRIRHTLLVLASCCLLVPSFVLAGDVQFSLRFLASYHVHNGSHVAATGEYFAVAVDPHAGGGIQFVCGTGRNTYLPTGLGWINQMVPYSDGRKLMIAGNGLADLDLSAHTASLPCVFLARTVLIAQGYRHSLVCRLAPMEISSLQRLTAGLSAATWGTAELCQHIMNVVMIMPTLVSFRTANRSLLVQITGPSRFGIPCRISSLKSFEKGTDGMTMRIWILVKLCFSVV